MDPPGRPRDRDRAITCTYVPGTSRYARSEAPGRSQPASGKTKRETWTSRTDLIIPRTPHRHRRDRAGAAAAVGARAAARARSPAFPLVFYHVFWPFAFPHEAYPRGQESGPPAPARHAPRRIPPRQLDVLRLPSHAVRVWSASPLGTPWSARRGLTGVAQAVFHIVYLPVLTPILRFYGASPYACCTLDVRVPCAPPLLEPLCDCDCDCCCCCWSQSSAA